PLSLHDALPILLDVLEGRLKLPSLLSQRLRLPGIVVLAHVAAFPFLDFRELDLTPPVIDNGIFGRLLSLRRFAFGSPAILRGLRRLGLRFFLPPADCFGPI